MIRTNLKSLTVQTSPLTQILEQLIQNNLATDTQRQVPVPITRRWVPHSVKKTEPLGPYQAQQLVQVDTRKTSAYPEFKSQFLCSNKNTDEIVSG